MTSRFAKLHPRARLYLGVGAALALAFFGLRAVRWEGGSQLHTLMETVATGLALTVGGLALVRFYARRNNTFLFIGTGFLGTGFLDGYHAVVTSAFFGQWFPTAPPSLIPWSWVASRLCLAVFLWLSWLAWRREEEHGPSGRVSERTVYGGAIVFTTACFLFFAFVPLGRAHFPNLIFHRPEEFVPAAFFLLALIGYGRKGAWRTDPFEHWLMLSLIVGFLSQAMFMSFSGQVFDLAFDAAHVLKKVSYLCVLTGLLVSMLSLFRQAEHTAGEGGGAARTEAAPPADRPGLLGGVSAPVAVSFALGLLLLIALSLISFRTTTGLLERNGWVQHSHRVRLALREVRSVAAEMTSAVRAYILTGEEHRLTAFTGADQRLLAAAARVRELAADNPRQQARLRELQPILEAQLAFANRLVEARRTAGPEAATKVFSTGNGAELLDRIHRRIQELDDEEKNLLQLRATASDTSTGKLLLILPTGTGGAVALFLAALYFLNREIVERGETEARLGNSERRFRSLVTASAQIVWNASAEGFVRGSLPDWQKYTGQTTAAIQGTGWTNALHPADIEPTLVVWKKAVATRTLFEVAYRIRRHDGVFRHFQVSGAPVLNEDGTLREWIGTCTDITEKQQAQKERDQFFALSLDLMCIARTDGYFHRLNPAFETVLGYSEAEMLSRPFMEFVHPADRAASTEAVTQLRSGASLVNFENRYLCKNGECRHFIWSCTPDVETGMLYATARDITERKLAEREIRELNESLERRVQARTAQLTAANQELDAFSYSVSHDLRAPLRAVDGFSQILEEDYAPRLDDEGRRYLRTIRDEAQRMGNLIDDLLQFARLGRQEMRTTQVDLTALAHSVAAELQAENPGHATELIIGALPPVQGDPAMLRQVLVNLIGNAFKYSSKKERARVEMGAELHAGEQTWYVRDNGAGFDMRYVDKLFGVFQRLHTDEEFLGTGVGLALVKRIILRHGGRVWAESTLGEGATFHFALPTGTPPADAADEPDPETADPPIPAIQHPTANV